MNSAKKYRRQCIDHFISIAKEKFNYEEYLTNMMNIQIHEHTNADLNDKEYYYKKRGIKKSGNFFFDEEYHKDYKQVLKEFPKGYKRFINFNNYKRKMGVN